MKRLIDLALKVRFAIACTVWGDLFNRPVCGFVSLGNKRSKQTAAPLPYTRL
jgi:hypothetical protein